jgi:hypothetical protein
MKTNMIDLRDILDLIKLKVTKNETGIQRNQMMTTTLSGFGDAFSSKMRETSALTSIGHHEQNKELLGVDKETVF